MTTYALQAAAVQRIQAGAELGQAQLPNWIWLYFDKMCCLISIIEIQYQPSGAGGTRSQPATTHRLQNPKWPPGGPKMAEGVWKGVYP